MVFLGAGLLHVVVLKIAFSGRDAGFFVFPDVSVRTEGSYRLKLTLYEVIE